MYSDNPDWIVQENCFAVANFCYQSANFLQEYQPPFVSHVCFSPRLVCPGKGLGRDFESLSNVPQYYGKYASDVLDSIYSSAGEYPEG